MNGARQITNKVTTSLGPLFSAAIFLAYGNHWDVSLVQNVMLFGTSMTSLVVLLCFCFRSVREIEQVGSSNSKSTNGRTYICGRFEALSSLESLHQLAFDSTVSQVFKQDVKQDQTSIEFQSHAPSLQTPDNVLTEQWDLQMHCRTLGWHGAKAQRKQKVAPSNSNIYIRLPAESELGIHASLRVSWVFVRSLDPRFRQWKDSLQKDSDCI